MSLSALVPPLLAMASPAELAGAAATLGLGVLAGAGAVAGLLGRRRARDASPPGRILLALTGDGLPCAAIDAAARLGRADHAVVVPAVLLPTPYGLPLDRASPDAGSAALDLLEAVERRLTRAHVAVDGRVVQGRTRRHAVRRLVAQERHDRLVVPAGGPDAGGFSAEDVGWLLAHVDGEILVLRAGPGEERPAAAPAEGPPGASAVPVQVAGPPGAPAVPVPVAGPPAVVRPVPDEVRR